MTKNTFGDELHFRMRNKKGDGRALKVKKLINNKSWI